MRLGGRSVPLRGLAVDHSRISMIPSFPQFKKLSLEDNDSVEQYTRHFPYYSDYNFSSLWAWDIEHGREISDLNGNLVVKFTDYQTGKPFLSFLGIHDPGKTTLALLDYSEAIGLEPMLRLMPEVSIHDLEDPGIQVLSDEANFDYIYLTERLAALEGTQYKSKRKAAEHFEKLYPNHGYEILNLSEPATQEAVRSIAEMWRKHRQIPGDDQSIIHESEAIENMFTLAKTRNLFAGVVTIDGVANAFTIEEIVNQILSIGHFWKTAHPSRGEYEYLARRTAAHLHDSEVVYWNWEQDLGIESLRASKSSYRPSDFLKKFIVTKKDH
jgi:hypothetical protein